MVTISFCPSCISQQGDCLSGFWCKNASSTESPMDGKTGEPCPTGNYCPSGIKAKNTYCSQAPCLKMLTGERPKQH